MSLSEKERNQLKEILNRPPFTQLITALFEELHELCFTAVAKANLDSRDSALVTYQRTMLVVSQSLAAAVATHLGKNANNTAHVQQMRDAFHRALFHINNPEEAALGEIFTIQFNDAGELS